MTDKTRHIEKIKRIAMKANAEGDFITLQACIAWLEDLWTDHRAAMQFYTMLELTAPAKWRRI